MCRCPSRIESTRCRRPPAGSPQAVRAGTVEACTSTEVLQEVLRRYSALRRLDRARAVYDLFVQICPVIFPVTLADTDRARDLLASGTGVRDAIHAAVMLNNGVTQIATFDQGFDVVHGVTTTAEHASGDDARRYWQSRPVSERLAFVDFLRRQHGGTRTRLRRVLRLVDRQRG